MKSDLTYPASNLKKSVKKSHMLERQSVSAVPNAEPQLDWFWTFFPFFCKFLTRHIKKRMTKCESILTPTTKEPKICHALATTSAFNLKLCPKALSKFTPIHHWEGGELKLGRMSYYCKNNHLFWHDQHNAGK